MRTVKSVLIVTRMGYVEGVFTSFRALANSFGQVGVGGGIYYRNFGVDISYMRDFELTRSGYEVGFSWKF